MSKILLIEDRIERQVLFSKDTSFDFSKYSKILDNRTSLDGVDLFMYTTIICHRSAFGELNNTILDRLKDHCKKSNTQLIFFSGGISSTFYSNNSYEFLLLNSKSFYSNNLEHYLNEILKNSISNLCILAYGKNWKINIMLDTLSKINMFTSQNKDKDKIKAQRLKTYSQLDNIQDLVDIEYPPLISGGAMLLDDVKKFSMRLSEQIHHEVLMNE